MSLAVRPRICGRPGCPRNFSTAGLDHDGAAIAGEQEQAVLETAEHLIKIFAKGTEDCFHAAQLLTDFTDLGADLSPVTASVRCCRQGS